jgi:hypothetical protein
MGQSTREDPSQVQHIFSSVYWRMPLLTLVGITCLTLAKSKSEEADFRLLDCHLFSHFESTSTRSSLPVV